MALTKEQLEIFTNNKKQQIILQTLQLSHSTFSEDFYIIRDLHDRTLTLENGLKKDFNAVNFSVKIPGFSQKLDSTLQFQIDVVNSELVSQISKLLDNPSRELIKVVFRAYTDQITSYPIIGPLYFEVDSFSFEKYKLVVNAKIHELIDIKFPLEKYDDRFKGLKYV